MTHGLVVLGAGLNIRNKPVSITWPWPLGQFLAPGSFPKFFPLAFLSDGLRS